VGRPGLTVDDAEELARKLTDERKDRLGAVVHDRYQPEPLVSYEEEALP
jgi:hypothetical protein